MKLPDFLTKRDIFKLLIESGLIVLSVLLALFLNEYRSHLKESRLKEQALRKVVSEIKTNLETVKEWLPYHEEVLNNLQNALESDSIKTSLISESEIVFWSLMPRGVVQSVINKAAWQALKSSSAFSNIDFDTMLSLSRLYDFQEVGVESTVKVISEVFTSREALKKEELEGTLLLLKNLFGELVAQEGFLIRNYESTLSEFEVHLE